MAKNPFDAFNDFLDEFADTSRLDRAINEALLTSAVIARTGVQQCFIDGKSPDGEPWPDLTWPRLEGGSNPLRNTGRMMASIEGVAEGTQLHVQTNRIGAGVQNFGATIVPVNAQFLTIPATLEAKRVGSARNFPRALSPHIGKSRMGGVLVDDEDVVQYFLTKKTVIPKREFIGFSGDTIDLILEVVAEKAIKYGLKGVT